VPFLCAAQSPPEAGRTCTGKAHAPGLAAYELPGDPGRQYRLFVPHGYTGAASLPVILDFHGSGSGPEQELEISGMTSVAEQGRFLLILPVARVPVPSGGYTWNVPPVPGHPDDVRFAREVIADAARRVCLDPDRVYLTGFSGGARLASRLACALPERIAAVGLVGGLRAPKGCGSRSVPVIAFHGTDDPINPYPGGGPAYWGHGMEAAVRAWAAQNRCADGPRETPLPDRVTVIGYLGCRDDADIVFYRIDGGGHTWPGSRLTLPPGRFGATIHDLDATALIGEFFAAHPGRRAGAEAIRNTGS